MKDSFIQTFCVTLLFAISPLSLGPLHAAVSDPATEKQTYFPPPDSSSGWRSATNATPARDLAGIDLSKLQPAWDFTQRCTLNGGLLVVRNGYLVFEKYFGRASRNANPDMASTGKAYTSIACGIMLREFRDKIPEGLDTKVFTEKFLPEGSMRALARSESAPSPFSGARVPNDNVGNVDRLNRPAGTR